MAKELVRMGSPEFNKKLTKVLSIRKYLLPIKTMTVEEYERAKEEEARAASEAQKKILLK